MFTDKLPASKWIWSRVMVAIPVFLGLGLVMGSAQVVEDKFLLPDAPSREICDLKQGHWFHNRCWDYGEEFPGGIESQISNDLFRFEMAAVEENGIPHLLHSVEIVNGENERYFVAVYTNSNSVSSLVFQDPTPWGKTTLERVEAVLYHGDLRPYSNSISPIAVFIPQRRIYARGMLKVVSLRDWVMSNVSPTDLSNTTRAGAANTGKATNAIHARSPSPVYSNSTIFSNFYYLFSPFLPSSPIPPKQNPQNRNAATTNGETHAFDLVSNLTELGGYIFSGELQAVSAPSNVQITGLLNPYALFRVGNSEFRVRGEEAYLYGTLGAKTYAQLQTLISNHPEVKTIVLRDIPGTVYAPYNNRLGRLLREAGFNTKLLTDSVVASGGVDLFLAGLERIAERGASLGVHDWCCFRDFTGLELPLDHPAHRQQIDYYSMILGDPMGRDFYFFTLRAKPFGKVYWLTKKELRDWYLVTQFLE